MSRPASKSVRKDAAHNHAALLEAAREVLSVLCQNPHLQSVMVAA